MHPIDDHQIASCPIVPGKESLPTEEPDIETPLLVSNFLPVLIWLYLWTSNLVWDAYCNELPLLHLIRGR